MSMPLTDPERDWETERERERQWAIIIIYFIVFFWGIAMRQLFTNGIAHGLVVFTHGFFII